MINPKAAQLTAIVFLATIAVAGCQNGEEESGSHIGPNAKYVWLECHSTSPQDAGQDGALWLRFERGGGEEAVIIQPVGGGNRAMGLRAVVSPEMISLFEREASGGAAVLAVDRKTLVLSDGGSGKVMGQCAQSDGRAIDKTKV